jgi:hypothetical protein
VLLGKIHKITYPVLYAGNYFLSSGSSKIENWDEAARGTSIGHSLGE